jgi:hypothetical protein
MTAEQLRSICDSDHSLLQHAAVDPSELLSDHKDLCSAATATTASLRELVQPGLPAPAQSASSSPAAAASPDHAAAAAAVASSGNAATPQPGAQPEQLQPHSAFDTWPVSGMPPPQLYGLTVAQWQDAMEAVLRLLKSAAAAEGDDAEQRTIRKLAKAMQLPEHLVLHLAQFTPLPTGTVAVTRLHERWWKRLLQYLHNRSVYVVNYAKLLDLAHIFHEKPESLAESAHSRTGSAVHNMRAAMLGALLHYSGSLTRSEQEIGEMRARLLQYEAEDRVIEQTSTSRSTHRRETLHGARRTSGSRNDWRKGVCSR